MGVVCAEEAIMEAEIQRPDAIVSGTGLGCVEDTEKFLHNILSSQEGLLTPTAFVQSTHNSIGATIALKYNCKGYNVLYAHETISFENALLDTNLLLHEKNMKNVLVGGFDEITLENYELKRKVGLYKKDSGTNLDIVHNSTIGSIPGEGATYFIITNEKSSRNYAQIKLLNFTHKLNGISKIKEWILNTLEQAGISVNDIDNFLAGINGDAPGDRLYYELIEQMFHSTNVLYYKHLCGEYDTSSAFGVWLAAKLLKRGFIADYLFLKNNHKPLHNILMYNQEKYKNHSLILLSKV